MKKHYVKPMMAGEEFMADEYVSACFGISCTVGASGGEKGAKDPVNHQTFGNFGTWHTCKMDGTGCGHSDNQFIVDTNGTYTMIEVNVSETGGGQPLDCTLYTENWEEKVGSWSDLQNGQVVYWTTTIPFFGKMYHYGNVELIDENRANHS